MGVKKLHKQAISILSQSTKPEVIILGKLIGHGAMMVIGGYQGRY